MSGAVTVEVLATSEHRDALMRADVLDRLTRRPRSIPPVWFYDETGSKLFDEITRLPEYYLTRAERAILAEHAGEIAAVASADTLVEIGSGTSEKTRLLLDAMADDDASGVTAQFNLNVLSVLNASLGSDFEQSGFRHVAAWNGDARWIEMRLRSEHDQVVAVPGLGLTLEISGGEEILTEISAKFDPAALESELDEAGLRTASKWLDPAGDFQLTLAGASPR